MSSCIPARLHVLLARDAPFGLVIRRGPSQQTAILGWNLQTDEITLGQWVKARIIARRCDLAPDGKNWIYFASAYNGRDDKPDTWSAIAVAPFLKATHFYPKGDSWNGGGLFLDKDTFWLNDGTWSPHKIDREMSRPRRVKLHPEVEPYHGEDWGIYFPRLKRDGWLLIKENFFPQRDEFVWEKRQRSWVLQKFACAGLERQKGRGVYFDCHHLRCEKTGDEVEGSEWEWADFWGKCVLWAQSGQLWSRRIWEGGSAKSRLVADLNDMKFDPRPAPY